MTTKHKFTRKQLKNFEEYEKLRQSGIVNMFEGRKYTSMTQEEYLFVMKNYSELSKEIGS